ncbi:MAG: hypothetical protein JWN33_203 [Candidatus Saccharibacteria bacterium]|nr:hypothetical protein [Candidatus Saccharibacteria bacterium]
MSLSRSHRRMAENEAIFRRLNQQVQAGFDEINAIAVEERAAPYGVSPDTLLEFYCECSDENCIQRISLTADEYNRVHGEGDLFTVIRGHEVLGIEDVVSTNGNYSLVRKHFEPSMDVDTLHKTSIDNS